MSDLGSRLLAAVVGSAKSECYGVTAFNSLQNSGVTLSPSVTPELSNEISVVTPSHAKSASWEGQEQDCANPKVNPVPAHSDAPSATWAEEERAAIAEYDGGAPRAWAEGFARLDPNKPPSDVPSHRWLRFVDDCGRFLDEGWAKRAAELGWGPLDLFGCDRERLFARVDQLGLLWLLKGGTIVELHRDRAILQTERGATQTYRRRPVEVGRVVLAWEISNKVPGAANS
jgi:hypothetical protein